MELVDDVVEDAVVVAPAGAGVVAVPTGVTVPEAIEEEEEVVAPGVVVVVVVVVVVFEEGAGPMLNDGLVAYTSFTSLTLMP